MVSETKAQELQDFTAEDIAEAMRFLGTESREAAKRWLIEEETKRDER